MASTVTTQVPDAGTLIFDAKGYINPVWHEFFFTMLRRTGGTEGTDIGDITVRVVVLERRADEAEKIEYSVMDVQQIPQDQIPAEAFVQQIQPDDLPAEAPNHGNQYDPDLHALVTTAAHGFMSASDKSKLDGVTPGAAVASVSGTAPIVSSGGTTPAISISPATGAGAGSMSAADKTKLDSMTSGAAVSAVSGTAPIVSSGGTAPTISITVATGAAAGSMSAADKAKLDLLIYNATTWTPTLTFTTPGDLAVVYANRAATYTQVGRLVMLNWVIVTSTFTFTTATGNLSITGFPLTPAGFQVTCGKIEWQGITKAGYTEIAAEIAGGSPTIAFVASGSAQARSSVNQANVTSGTQITLIGSMMITV